METKQKTNGFVTFLETLHDSTSRRHEPVDKSLELWSKLEDGTPKYVVDLLSESGMSLDTFTMSLKALQEAGLVEFIGESNNEKVKLTSRGKQLVQSKQ